MKHVGIGVACLFVVPALLAANSGPGLITQDQSTQDCPAQAQASRPQSQTEPQQPPSIEAIQRAISEPEVVTATVTGVDQTSQIVMLRDACGTDRALYVGDEIGPLRHLNAGDRVTVTYHLSLATIPLAPGEAPRPGTSSGAVGTAGSATTAGQVRWTVTVNEVDKQKQTATVVDARGRSFTVRVEDATRLDEIDPGDRIEVVLTAARIVRVEQAP